MKNKSLWKWSFLALAIVCLGVLGASAQAAGLPTVCTANKEIPEGLGAVILHGKTGSPSGYVQALANHLKSKHVLVKAPAMPWSENRIYDRSFDDAMLEIDESVANLKKGGAKRIFIIGHSLGANAALRYGATRSGLAGVVVLAAGGSADTMFKFVKKVRSSVDKARKMRGNNKGGDRASFNDLSNKPFKVKTTADIYLSYLDPDGPAVARKNALSLKPGTAVLWVYGSRDKLKFVNDRAYAFDELPPHPLHAYVTIKADHGDTPKKAKDIVATWLACVGSSR